MRGLLVPVLLCLLGGCAGFVPQLGPADDPPGRYVDLTRPIVAVGDTQEHESTGFPLRDNDSAVDAFVEVAQRPPEQPLFGRRILEWALQRHADEPFIHLGDVMDLSCRSEAQRITRLLRESGRPGAVLPGNHDGLMFGIYGYNVLATVLDANARRWNHACQRGAAPDDVRHKGVREAVSKRDFIDLYLREQAQRRGGTAGLAWPGNAHTGGEQRLSWRSPEADAFVAAIEARLRVGYAYTDSFVAQLLRPPRAAGAARGVVIVGLDTNQTGALASAWDTLRGRSPGSMGQVHRDQVAAITPWVDEAAARGDIVIFAGHHNWQSLGLPTRLMLRQLMSRLTHPLVYLSAHTHRGFWALHTALDRRPLLELNVSSLSDWPVAYRRIHFAYDEAAERLMVRAELLPHAGRPVLSDRDLLAAWTDEACARIGPEPEAFLRFDRDLVARQRAARGGLAEWLIGALEPACADCEAPLYRHARDYLDAQLDTILQLASHLGQRAHGLYDVVLPAWCGSSDFFECARSVQAQQPTDTAALRQAFRRQAQLVDLLGTHLDDLRSPQAAAYMTCRATHAARRDFELTPDTRNANRSEANRRAEQFFRVEASVGLR